MRTLIVTAADANFFPLLQGLIRSLHQWGDHSIAEIGVLDLGLLPEQRAWVTLATPHIVEAGWDLQVDETVRKEKPHFRAYTARPFLPRYFPGYEMYVWLDADTWVQERSAFDMLVDAAKDGALAAVPEYHDTYKKGPASLKWYKDRIRKYFGYPALRYCNWSNYFNSGVFALRGDAPHWSLWAKWLSVGLEKSHSALFCDQSAFNYAVCIEKLPYIPLPAYCNWLCHFAVPHYDYSRRLFCVPDDEKQTIGILHLIWTAKNLMLNISAFGPRNLRYHGRHLSVEGNRLAEVGSLSRGIRF